MVAVFLWWFHILFLRPVFLQDGIKPRLRGWIHASAVPLVLFLGFKGFQSGTDWNTRIAVAIFILAILVLFGTSALYHITYGIISQKNTRRLQIIDYINITITICCSATSFALLLLDGSSRTWFILLMWGMALLMGVIFVAVGKRHRTLALTFFLALGWLPLFFGGAFLEGLLNLGENTGYKVLGLIAVGGVAYTVGALSFGFKFPRIKQKAHWASFHEVFHSCTVIAFLCHFAAISITVQQLS